MSSPPIPQATDAVHLYRHSRCSELRFDTALKSSGEDILFWLKLARVTDRIAFPTRCEAHYGAGVNICHGARWGSVSFVNVAHDDVLVGACQTAIVATVAGAACDGRKRRAARAARSDGRAPVRDQGASVRRGRRVFSTCPWWSSVHAAGPADHGLASDAARLSQAAERGAVRMKRPRSTEHQRLPASRPGRSTFNPQCTQSKR